MRQRLALSNVLLVLAVLAAPALAATAPGERPITAEQRAFWAFRPVRKAEPPAVRQSDWCRTPIDRFVLAQLEKHGLTPAPEASKTELIRRVSFDLTGLPPTPEEVEAFVKDGSPAAYARVVDRYLDSPRYGERWAQHWLDVVRYAETEGFEYDRQVPGLWRYRDYVIRSFNDDKPYDRFVTEQLAGDEIDPSNRELLIAAGFHRLGAVRRNAGNQEVASSRNEVLTDRTDIIGAAFLGLTMGCARCHDHKFDPIPQKDYYRLQAFVAAADEQNVALASDAEQAAWKAKTAEVTKQLDEVKRAIKSAEGAEREKLKERVEALEEAMPAPLPTIATVHDAEPTEIHVLKRGEWERKGDAVGMRAPTVLVSDEAPEQPLATARPRLKLARWLTDPRHPLTARVMANRVWGWHFGQGIVRTPNDFGVNGARPTNPELLDYLAATFVEGGWKLKPLHRLILLSSAYRQSSASPNAGDYARRDPQNDRLWHFNRRRLSAEEIRDAMLAASGRLNCKAGGEGVIVPVDQELVSQLYKPSQWTVTRDSTEHDRRSIYLLAKRNLRLPFMEVFDQPTAQSSCARRETSTHAPQSLELLNGRTSNDLARAFAKRMERDAASDHAAQVDLAFRLAAGRPPTAREKQLAVAFLDEGGSLDEFALAMFNLNAFLYVN